MFNKKPIKSTVFANGSNENGLRYGGGGWKSSLDTNKLGLERYKTREGINRIDIIPFNAGPKHPLVVAGQCEEGDTVYSLDYFVHKTVGPAKADYTCLKQFGQRCPICEESQRWYDKGDEESKKKGGELRSKRRVVYLVHDLIDGKYYYWDTGWQSFEKPVNEKASMTTDSNTGAAVNPFDWEVGKTIVFKCVKDTYNNNTYNKISEVTFTFEDRAPLSDEVLSHSVDLSSAIIMATENEMDSALAGKVVATDTPPENTVAANDATAQPSFDTMETVTSGAIESQPVAPQSETPAPAQSAPATSPETTCPCGYTFGTADDHPECATCKVWDKCIDA